MQFSRENLQKRISYFLDLAELLGWGPEPFEPVDDEKPHSSVIKFHNDLV